MNELFTKLGIDVRLIVIQAVNFSLLLFLLNKFLYKRLLKALDARRELAEKTAREAHEVAEAKLLVEQETQEARVKIKKEADALIIEAKKQADALQADILMGAERQAAELKARAGAEIAKDKIAAVDQARRELASLALFVAEKVLGREVSGADNMRIAEQAIDEIK